MPLSPPMASPGIPSPPNLPDDSPRSGIHGKPNRVFMSASRTSLNTQPPSPKYPPLRNGSSLSGGKRSPRSRTYEADVEPRHSREDGKDGKHSHYAACIRPDASAPPGRVLQLTRVAVAPRLSRPSSHHERRVLVVSIFHIRLVSPRPRRPLPSTQTRAISKRRILWGWGLRV